MPSISKNDSIRQIFNDRVFSPLADLFIADFYRRFLPLVGDNDTTMRLG